MVFMSGSTLVPQSMLMNRAPDKTMQEVMIIPKRHPDPKGTCNYITERSFTIKGLAQMRALRTN